MNYQKGKLKKKLSHSQLLKNNKIPMTKFNQNVQYLHSKNCKTLKKVQISGSI